jgi:hypothetical protein
VLADSILLFDARSRDVVVLTPSLHYARTFKSPGSVFSAFALDNNKLLLHAVVSTPELVGFPYHVIDAVGGRVSAFGESHTPIRVGDGPNIHRFLAVATHAVFAAEGGRNCSVSEWTRTAVKKSESSCASLTMLDFTPQALPEDVQKPGVQLRALLAGPLPHSVWMAVTLPRDNWKPADAGIVARHRPAVGAADLDKYVMSLILLVDLERRFVVARATAPIAAVGSTSDGLLISRTMKSNGLEVLTLWRLEVLGRR